MLHAPDPGAPRGLRRGKAFDLFDSPREWLEARRAQMENNVWMGEAIPNVRVDIGPVALAAFLGAPLDLAVEENTSWQTPVLDSFEPLSRFDLDPENPWFRKVLEFSAMTAEDARGNYLVCMPDMTGAMDTLANLRDPNLLCVDLFEDREAIQAAAARVVDAWEKAFVAIHEAVVGRGAGIVQWLNAWSGAPHTVPTCDFNALIGPRDFEEMCLPSLVEQATRAGRCLFHLDGPAAARHAEALAAQPAITAIQYTPGAGTPSALAKIDMLGMLQQNGKPLLLFCPPEEIPELLRKLDPRGLALAPQPMPPLEEFRELLELRDRAATRG